MKIAVINPQTDTDMMRDGYEFHENLAVGLMASSLRTNGYDVDIYDLRIQQLNERQVVEMIIDTDVRLIGLSINYATCTSALKIAQFLKLRHQCTIILGGEHATYIG